MNNFPDTYCYKCKLYYTPYSIDAECPICRGPENRMNNKISQSGMAELMASVFDKEINKLRGDGQKEYAHDTSHAMANFDRTAADLEIDRKMVLWTFAMKHRDGIAAYIKGHKSQREDVRGRINDLIVYLFLLRGMIEEEEGGVNEQGNYEPNA